jgi:hypothetical protein
VSDDDDAGSSDEPEHGSEGRGPQTDRNGNDEQCRVELGRGSAPAADLQVVSVKFANGEHASDYEADVEEQRQVGEQAIDAEHGEDSGIVAGEVAQVVIDAALGLAKAGRLRDALDVEELANGTQVGKAGGDGRGAQAVEASREVHAGRQGVDGDAEARHADGGRQMWPQAAGEGHKKSAVDF